MAVDWSDNIVLARLDDEPMLSDELNGLSDRLEKLSGEDDGASTPHVVLDFGGVSYVNSSNIAQLLRLKRQLDGASRQMRLCAMGDEVWSVMMVTGLEKVFRFAPDTMTALAGLQLDDAGPDEVSGDGGEDN
ncbi:MAG: STAS domain-containing protein [Phycisphaeraceae bacterium]|nr:MAG: STAS domain-containing protein [Phycisphaeraceae bacterium]